MPKPIRPSKMRARRVSFAPIVADATVSANGKRIFRWVAPEPCEIAGFTWNNDAARASEIVFALGGRRFPVASPFFGERWLFAYPLALAADEEVHVIVTNASAEPLAVVVQAIAAVVRPR